MNIKPRNQKIVFDFVMADDLFKEDLDISKVGRVDKDFYDINQETFQFNIDYDSQIGYYCTRLSIDLKALDFGEYTLVYEMYYDENKIDQNQVVIGAFSVPLNVPSVTTNTFTNHSPTIISFHKYRETLVSST